MKFTEEEFNNLFSGHEAFNTFLENFANELKLDLIINLPEIVVKYVKDAEEHNKLKDDFYTSNPDFLPYKDIVQKIVYKMAGENPDKSHEEVLELAIPNIKRIIKG